MRFNTPIESWTHRILAALALAPIAGCGGSVEIASGAGGAGSSGSAGTSSSGSASSSGSSSSGVSSSSSASSSSGSSSSGGPSFPCVDPQPIVVAGADTGYVSCKGGWTHRASVKTCPNATPRPAWTCPQAANVGCKTDADCAGQPNGYCQDGVNFGGPGCFCSTGCTTDAECGAGFVCLCGDPIGACAEASCASDAACSQGELCSTYVAMPGCGGTGFACQAPGDSCAADSDCPPNEQCAFDGKHHVCTPPMCAIGRPFLIDGSARVAPAAARGDWRAIGLRPSLDGLGVAEREALTARWTRAGQMEHASIAAFARFVMELLSVGAPPGLVHDAQAALRDETEHATACFALASAYAGRPIGPGKLSIAGALDDLEPASILERVILEGCIGETVAAVEAAEEAARTADPVVKRVLEQIAEEETLHAELAWRYVQWALAADPALRGAAEAAFGAARREREGVVESAAERDDVVGDGALRALRAEVVRRTVEPCARALLAAAA